MFRLRNPVSSQDESVEAVATTKGYEIFWAEGSAQPLRLTNNDFDDLRPRLCIHPQSGNSLAIFWRDTTPPQVICLRRKHPGTDWDEDWLVSIAHEDSRFPVCAFRDGDTVARAMYEVREADGTRSVQSAWIDVNCPGPNCPRGQDNLRVSTSMQASVQVEIHVDETTLWADWIHSSSQMGYSVYDPAKDKWENWQVETIETTVEDARASIRQKVLAS